MILDLLIVDVRCNDYWDGKIRNSIRVPFDRLCENDLRMLEERSNGKKAVIFHCQHSVKRGVKTATVGCISLVYNLQIGSFLVD